MQLTGFDQAVIGVFFALTLGVGCFYGRRGGQSVGEFFLSGRSVPWWLAGTSMVATTFSADTPLAVTGMVLQHGIAGNWLWWNAVASGMLTVFFFAALWRRAGVMTDVELVEIRYSGKAAALLRGLRAAYLALPINCIILGWVNLAMVKVLGLTLGLGRDTAVVLCMALTGLYVSISGLWGVLVTDLIQFVVMIVMTIVLAATAVGAAGGIAHIRASLPAASLSFVPDLDSTWMPAITFAVYVGVQWWAAWYPGAEPGGGGYVAQRIFSARSEREGVYATLWFNLAHYVLRSWPWILTALACAVLYPRTEDPEGAYVRVMIDHLPPKLRGLMMAGFLAAYMSTVATHLNWGASYLVNDLYKRFVHPNADPAHDVRASRAATVATVLAAALVTRYLDSVAGAWKLLLALGSGTGLVLILRWYWWRINAWSEISAMAASLAAFVGLRHGLGLDPDDPRGFAWLMLGTLGLSTLTWVTVTFATKPEPEATLVAFFERVRPDGGGWAPIAAKAAPARETGKGLAIRLRDWFFGCVLVYAGLFGVGKLLLGELRSGVTLLAGALVAALVLAHDLRHGV
jgi:Na+/proline symporter